MDIDVNAFLVDETSSDDSDEIAVFDSRDLSLLSNERKKLWVFVTLSLRHFDVILQLKELSFITFSETLLLKFSINLGNLEEFY